MTDKEKIRAEIDRRYKECKGATPATEYQELLDFIDSMQEEPNTKEYLCIKDFYPYKKGKVYKSIGGGFPANAKEYFTLVEKPVSEELWESSRQYALRQVFASTDAVMTEQAYLSLQLFNGFEIAVAHKDGANWQKQQMMKNAKEGVITFDYYGDNDKIYGCIAHDSFSLEELGLKDGDKVKLIIIKEG